MIFNLFVIAHFSAIIVLVILLLVFLLVATISFSPSSIPFLLRE
jgi:hypothetical protein